MGGRRLPTSQEASTLREVDWLREMEKARPEISVPGYWQTLEDNCSQWAKEMSVCPYWNTAKEKLPHWASEYRRSTGGDLLAKPGLPDFIGKSCDRIRSKLYQDHRRKKVDPTKALPPGGPPVPLLDDLVRTRINCKFLDGVEYLGKVLFHLAEEMNLNPGRDRKGRIEGYYAQHITFEGDVFFRMGGSSSPVRITCEIQLATDLSTRIWEATHPIYEETRDTDEEPADWQWDPNDVRFVSRQLGHMIHLADGLLVRLRETVWSGVGRKGKK